MSRAPFITMLAMLVAGCGATFRPFANQPVLWADDDMRPFEGPPPVQYNPWAWDTIDNTLFRQASEALAYRRGREAVNVNALDEVPDSSWYTNRLSRRGMTLDELRAGSCRDTGVPPSPFEVVVGKFDGTSPGAVVQASDGERYVMKVDFAGQPERATAADSIATRLLYAMGYEVPCNIVMQVDPSMFTIRDGARRRRSSEEPYTQADLDELLATAGPAPGGLRRVSFSRYIDGELLGGFRFSGVRGDDPNDVIPHEERRELRGFYVASAWMNHVDARAENNMDVWVSTAEGRGYIRHFILDAGDSFGIVWDADVDDGLARRFGNAHYLDLEQVLGDVATLGLADRAYRRAVRGPAFEVFGYYDAERFDADDWRNGYPNPAFERRTEADMAWMARILSRLGEPQVRAIVETGRFSRELWQEELVRILLGRRERILERYLLRLSPLSFPDVRGERLCLSDLAVDSGMRELALREYRAIEYRGLPPIRVGELGVDTDGSHPCVTLPPHDGYRVIDIGAGTRGRERSAPARIHLMSEAGTNTLVGLERPSSDEAP